MIVGLYRALPSSLYETADAAVEYFKNEHGVSKFRVEEPIHKDVAGRPTLSIEHAGRWICVEVSDTAYPKSLDQFVLDCKNQILPVMLYVAMPKGQKDPDYQPNIVRARASGVGLLHVDADGGALMFDALALSLTGVRTISKEDFPARFRPAIVKAEQTFRGGSPEKGCLLLYDQIERLTRGAAVRALKLDVWTKANPKGHVPAIDLENGPWRSVLAAMVKHCDFKKIGCGKLDTDLLNRVVAVVPFRNDTGHEPKKLADRIKRDRQLRTRFETAADLLEDVVEAVKGLRLS